MTDFLMRENLEYWTNLKAVWERIRQGCCEKENKNDYEKVFERREGMKTLFLM